MQEKPLRDGKFIMGNSMHERHEDNLDPVPEKLIRSIGYDCEPDGLASIRVEN